MNGSLFGQKKLYAALAGVIPEEDMPSFSTVRRWVEGKAPIPSWIANEIHTLLNTTKSGLPSDDDRPLMKSDVIEIIDALARSGALDATAQQDWSQC